MSEELDTPVQDDGFDAAFNDAAGTAPVNAPEVEAVDDGKADPDAEPATTTAATDAEPTQEPAATDPEPAQEPVATDAEPAPAPTPAPAATDPAPTAAPADLDPKYLAQALAEAQRIREAETTPASPATDKVYAADDFLDAAAKASIDKFKQEWPEEFPAIQRMYQAEVQAQVTNATNALIKQLNGVLAPLFQTVGKTEVNAHWGAIRAAHADIDAVLPAVKEWVDKQPAFLQGSMRSVLEKGTAQAVVDLVSMYKGATVQTGAAPATPASSAAQEPAPKPAAKPAVNPAALAATAAVPATQRQKPKAGADHTDFGSAFAEAEAMLAATS